MPGKQVSFARDEGDPGPREQPQFQRAFHAFGGINAVEPLAQNHADRAVQTSDEARERAHAAPLLAG
jgi:hypothetical protein